MGDTQSSVSPALVFARPTADQIWLGPSQQTALSQLSRSARACFLVGSGSSGKTTLLSHLASRMAAERVVLQCRGPKEDATSLLASLLLSADLAPWELSEIEQRNLLTVFLQQRFSQGRRVIVIIDDAHTCKPEAWEEIERLVAFEADRKSALEVLLAGSPSLVNRLDCARVALDPKGIHVHELAAPSQEELISYMAWRLHRFEMDHLMTPNASQLIAKLAVGRFAVVDALCQMSLLLARQQNLECINARVARQALDTLVSRQVAKPESQESAVNDKPAHEPPQGYLVISRGGKVLSRAALGQRMLLGRSEHNDLCLASPYLSRHHAVIVGTPDGYYVVDLNSANGVLLNGTPVARAVLCDQDILTLGPFRLKVQIPEWMAHGNPLPQAESLATTAVMAPPLPQTPSTMRRIK
jgi:type II secretory pathway predicted ATPase ExeA